MHQSPTDGAGVVAAAAARWPRHRSEQMPIGSLRFAAAADLRVVDPVWTSAYITRDHGYLVYDTLFGTDDKHQIKPQMVDQTVVSDDGMKYTFTLVTAFDGTMANPCRRKIVSSR